MDKIKRIRHYSGGSSHRFWDRVKAIPRNQGGETAYALGCALQDLEGRVMAYLEQAEAKRKPATPRPSIRSGEGVGD